MVPAGFSRSSLKAASSASISSNRGPRLCSRRSPASVGETLRVVRVKKPNAEPRFKFAQGVAQRRLRNAELRRGFREAALARYGQEGLEVIQSAALHL
jgi:hypothetical protein